eukprot:ANDGO_07794.mRNA.1 Isopentenyl-diphosphate Delta-isomerase
MSSNHWDGTQTQESLLDSESVILVDENDAPIGCASKKISHIMDNINNGMLHRAFSVLLFSSDLSKTLLHYRSKDKITFPGVVTNACCSHPLFNLESEREEEGHRGVIRAAIRKLEHELGIPTSTFAIEDFQFMTRVHYVGVSDAKWGEHEIDHVMILVCKDDDIVDNNKLNPSEIERVQWFTKDELSAEIEKSYKSEVFMSPWFRAIAENLLIPKWWPALVAGGVTNWRAKVSELVEENVVHRYLLEQHSAPIMENLVNRKWTK